MRAFTLGLAALAVGGGVNGVTGDDSTPGLCQAAATVTVTVTSVPPTQSTSTVTVYPTITETLVLNTPVKPTPESSAEAESDVTGPIFTKSHYARVTPAPALSGMTANSNPNNGPYYFTVKNGSTIWLGSRTPDVTVLPVETIVATYQIVPVASLPPPDTTVVRTLTSTSQVTSTKTKVEVAVKTTFTLTPLTEAEAADTSSSFATLSVLGSMGVSYSRANGTGSAAATIFASSAALPTLQSTTDIATDVAATGVFPHPPGATEIGPLPRYTNSTSHLTSGVPTTATGRSFMPSANAPPTTYPFGTGLEGPEMTMTTTSPALVKRILPPLMSETPTILNYETGSWTVPDIVQGSYLATITNKGTLVTSWLSLPTAEIFHGPTPCYSGGPQTCWPADSAGPVASTTESAFTPTSSTTAAVLNYETGTWTVPDLVQASYLATYTEKGTLVTSWLSLPTAEIFHGPTPCYSGGPQTCWPADSAGPVSITTRSASTASSSATPSITALAFSASSVAAAGASPSSLTATQPSPTVNAYPVPSPPTKVGKRQIPEIFSMAPSVFTLGFGSTRITTTVDRNDKPTPAPLIPAPFIPDESLHPSWTTLPDFLSVPTESVVHPSSSKSGHGHHTMPPPEVEKRQVGATVVATINGFTQTWINNWDGTSAVDLSVWSKTRVTPPSPVSFDQATTTTVVVTITSTKSLPKTSSSPSSIPKVSAEAISTPSSQPSPEPISSELSSSETDYATVTPLFSASTVFPLPATAEATSAVATDPVPVSPVTSHPASSAVTDIVTGEGDIPPSSDWSPGWTIGLPKSLTVPTAPLAPVTLTISAAAPAQPTTFATKRSHSDPTRGLPSVKL